MTNEHENSVNWRLARGATHRLVAARGGEQLALASGRVWLTRTGGGSAPEADVVLVAPAGRWLPGGSRWVIEAWDDASWTLRRAAPPALASVQRRPGGASAALCAAA